MTSLIYTCDNCNKGQPDEFKLKTCSKCILAKYCNKECQVNDWEKHKKMCNILNKCKMDAGEFVDSLVSRGMTTITKSEKDQVEYGLNEIPSDELLNLIKTISFEERTKKAYMYFHDEKKSYIVDYGSEKWEKHIAPNYEQLIDPHKKCKRIGVTVNYPMGISGCSFICGCCN